MVFEDSCDRVWCASSSEIVIFCSIGGVQGGESFSVRHETDDIEPSEGVSLPSVDNFD